jgi:hypothetical protein
MPVSLFVLTRELNVHGRIRSIDIDIAIGIAVKLFDSILYYPDVASLAAYLTGGFHPISRTETLLLQPFNSRCGVKPSWPS